MLTYVASQPFLEYFGRARKIFSRTGENNGSIFASLPSPARGCRGRPVVSGTASHSLCRYADGGARIVRTAVLALVDTADSVRLAHTTLSVAPRQELVFAVRTAARGLPGFDVLL